VAQCKECGTNLPEQARFCLHCGTPVEPEHPEVTKDETPPPSRQETPPPELDFVRPAITGGAFLGFLSSLPLVSAGNCLCCMWVLGGGGIATMLLAKQQPRRRLSFGDGAFAGVSSGLIGAIIATLVTIPIKILSRPFLESQQDSIEKMFRDLPADLQGPVTELMKRVLSPEISAATVLAAFISNLLIYALFAMIGGILMVAYLNKKGGGIQPPPNQGIGV
jgi:hypothetical protein